VRILAAPLACLLALGLTAACGGDGGKGNGGGATAFEDVPWILASGLDTEGWEMAAPSAMFADGTVGGSTGCNRFTAPYTVDGDALELGTVASTQMACPPPADAVEREYLAALGRVAGWRSEDQELVLVDDGTAELLRYGRATPVGDWEVTAFLSGNAVSSPLLGSQITARFSEDGTLTGSAGCNSYNATFTTDRGKIEISMPAATKKLCSAPKGVMEQEAAYLAALPAAVRYRVDGGSLSLLTADGTYVVSYARAGQP